MIKAIIFDLDGVLVDARELHYQALNRALEALDERFVISRDEHLSTFDGLPTINKLKVLTGKKGLPQEKYDDVWQGKQRYTKEIVDKEFVYDESMRDVLRKLKADGCCIAVCSNSIRETTKMMLIRKGLMEFVEFFLSNQDVRKSKPNPEMYLRAMVKLGVGPRECLIVEDSHVGRQAAFESGAHLCPVENTGDVTYERVKESMDRANATNTAKKFMPKWQGSNLKIIIPMAGEGKRFQERGYSFPKPLIDINGKPMIQWVIENINAEARFVFIVKAADAEKYNLKHLLNLLAPECVVVTVDKPTRGAVESVFAARHLIDTEGPIAIVNSDQYMLWNSNEFFYAMAADSCDGGIVTFESVHPKWSFVRTGKDGFVAETAEKKPISNQATAGVYYFSEGADFFKYARQMMEKGLTVDGQYFVCPVYNEMIRDGKQIRVFPIKGMWSYSTPEDVEHFISKFDESKG